MGDAAAKGADASAALVRCADVTVPAALTGCAVPGDALGDGRVSLTRGGGIRVQLHGAGLTQDYDVVLRSFNGSVELALGVVTTDASGDGEMSRASIIDLDQAGLVSIALKRAGAIHYVSGFTTLADGGLASHFVPCGQVNLPVALTGCGIDLLRRGSVRIEERNVLVTLATGTGHGNHGNVATYDIVLVGLDNPSETLLGTMTTNAHGVAQPLLLTDFFADGIIGAGHVLARRQGATEIEFITGFQSTRRSAREPAKFHVGMVRCAEANLPTLATCGADLFGKGFAIIDEKGDVKTHLFGAVPQVDYDVVFVPFDGATEVTVGTIRTNPAGNGHLHARDIFGVGTRGVGQIIIKRDGLDQFVTGFRVVR
ncbi:MAG TPA: hypothetical protein VFV05_07435 [Methylomirabilota bacterium]|nr:hypothetical protein [Methylomirabilota bacterium]